mgnify:CR=1 FL=1
MAYIGKEPIVGNFQKCDAITVVNGQAAYTLQVSSTNVTPESANHMLVSLNGILQAPVTSFSVSGSTLTFASNLATGDVIDFVILLGNVLDLGTVSDGTITNAKLASDVISGETDIGGAIADADLFLMDDGAGGTLRKTAASRIKTYAGGANTPAFLAYKNSDQGSISANTPTKVTYTVEVFDTDGTYSSSRFTPGVEGKYFIHAMVYANGVDATKGPDALIRKNGADALHASQIPGAGANVPVEVSGILELDDDDYVEVYVDTGATGTVFSAGTTVIFCGFKIIT